MNGYVVIQVRKCETQKSEKEDEKYYCSICGKEISKNEYESYDEMCWECWDDQMTEESGFASDWYPKGGSNYGSETKFRKGVSIEFSAPADLLSQQT